MTIKIWYQQKNVKLIRVKFPPSKTLNADWSMTGRYFFLNSAHGESKIVRSRLGLSFHSNGLSYREAVVPFSFFFLLLLLLRAMSWAKHCCSFMPGYEKNAAITTGLTAYRYNLAERLAWRRYYTSSVWRHIVAAHSALWLSRSRRKTTKWKLTFLLYNSTATETNI